MLYDDDTSEGIRYQRPRHRVIALSSNANESNLTTSPRKPSDPDQKPPGHPSSLSTSNEGSGFLLLMQCIANSFLKLQKYGFISNAPLERSSIEIAPPEFIGKGKTFYVTKVLLSNTLKLEHSLPTKLVTKAPAISENQYVTYKKPLIEFDSSGNPKDDKLEKRLKAIILEVRVLTHLPLYFHKNIVDFLGVNWKSELPELEPGREIVGLVNKSPGILLEYAQHGSLADLRRTKLYTAMPMEGRASLCRDVAEGLAALHRCGIVHGDIKLDNILVFDAYDSDGKVVVGLRAKLADFGFSIERASKGDEELAKVARWELAGRTWPWNDPEWNLPRTWSQLEKTDVFSYGLLVWVVLSGEELGTLFGFDETNRNDIELRRRVEALKNLKLSCNAASYFRSDKFVWFLVEYLFKCSLDPRVEKRGTMKDILKFWDIWFMEDPPYQSIPLGISLNPDQHIEATPRINFQHIVNILEMFPPPIKQQFANINIDHSASIREKLEATIFRAFCHLTGWGVEKNPREGQRIIDEAAEFCNAAAIFQPMFFDEAGLQMRSGPNATIRDYTEYDRKVLRGLITHSFTGSYEAVQNLRRHFPMQSAEYYVRLQSMIYRHLNYGIQEDLSVFQESGLELCVYQFNNLERNSLRGSEVVGKLGHSILHFAVCSGFTEAIKQILESDDFDPKSLEESDCNGDTPLLASCQLGSFHAAKLLIEAGANVKAKNKAGETTLHFLTHFDNPEQLNEISDLILDQGKELIDAACESSYPREFVVVKPRLNGVPLNRAVLANNVQLVKILLKHGANPLKVTSEQSPLCTAATNHFTEVLQLFLEAFPNAEEWRSCTLLGHAMHGATNFQRVYFHASRTQEMMKSTLDLLLENVRSAGIPLYINSFPLISYGAMFGSAEVVDHIISRIGTAEINTYTRNHTALHISIKNGSGETVKVLLENGADPYLPMEYPMRISNLELCCIHWGYTKQMLKLLLKHQPKVRKDGDSTIDKVFAMAVLAINFEAASVLLDAGADIDWVDDNGMTILGQIVRQCTYSTVTQLRFLLDHQIALKRKPAGPLVIPAHGITVFHLMAMESTACRNPKEISNILDYLLTIFDSPEILNAQITGGYTALHLAVRSTNVRVVQRFLRFDTIDLDLRLKGGKTAYSLAVAKLVSETPKEVQEMGDRAIEQHKKDKLEICGMFMGESGLNHWNMMADIPFRDAKGKTYHMLIIEAL